MSQIFARKSLIKPPPMPLLIKLKTFRAHGQSLNCIHSHVSMSMFFFVVVVVIVVGGTGFSSLFFKISNVAGWRAKKDNVQI